MLIRIFKYSFCFFTALIFLGLSLSEPVFSKDNQYTSKNCIFSIVNEIEASRNDLIAQIRKAEDNIQNAKDIIAQARRENNKEAAEIGRQALSIAVQAKEKAERKKSYLDKDIINLRLKLSTLSSSDTLISAVVSGYSGEVAYYSKKLGREIPLNKTSIAYLSPGDKIITGKDGRVQMYCFGGRGKVEIGKNTVLVIKNNDGYGSLSLIAGQVDFKIKKIKKDVKKYLEKYFKVYCPTVAIAVRGTEFSVHVHESKAADIAVVEGSVEVSRISREVNTAKIILESGHKLHITADGKLGDVQILGPEDILEH